MFPKQQHRAFPDSLDALGLKHIDSVHVQQMDSVDYIGEMQEVGGAVAEQKVKAEPVAGFVEPS